MHRLHRGREPAHALAEHLGPVAGEVDPDRPAVLAGAQVSISRVGYNTVADIYRAGCRAIVVPFSDGIKTEQITRAKLLAARGLAETISPEEETPETVAAAIDRAMGRPAPDRSALDLEGARNSALILKRLVAGEPVDRFR